MAELPQKISLDAMQNRWSSILTPVLNNPLVNGSFLKSIVLINGVTTLNHLLGRQMQGWFITDQNAAASIYRSAPLNGLTLTLTSNAAVTVNLYVF